MHNPLYSNVYATAFVVLVDIDESIVCILTEPPAPPPDVEPFVPLEISIEVNVLLLLEKVKSGL
jgi:hypothetical protein